VAWEIIDEMRDYEQGNSDSFESEMPKSGDKVLVTSGQFAGLEAIYHEADGEKRSFLMLDLINKPVKLSVPNSDIEI
jgi:transcriptional antiterminator RfaH